MIRPVRSVGTIDAIYTTLLLLITYLEPTRERVRCNSHIQIKVISCNVWREIILVLFGGIRDACIHKAKNRA